MRKTFLLIIALSSAFLSAPGARSYVQSPTSSADGTGIAWNLNNPATSIVVNRRIVYNINSAGSDDVPFAEVEKALEASFQAWEAIPTSEIAFTRGPDTTVRTTGSDGLFPLFWVENSTTTDDGQSVAGALAVAFTFRITSGPNAGQITDANIVFNGKDNTWATNGNPAAIDIAEVATHEIGHALGLSHSPIAASTMWPVTGSGETKSRTPSSDDQIAVSVLYPAPGFLASTGRITGRVRDTNMNNIFGAHVVAVDQNGNVAAGALSQPDGTYTINGLSPGNYTLYAEPLSASNGLFLRNDLPSFYNSAVTDFLTTPDQVVTVTAGAAATLDFTVTRGTAPFTVRLIEDTNSPFFRRRGTTVRPGQNNVTVGVAGPGLPTSGTPLSISGSGISVLSTSFGTLSGGDPVIQLTINVAANAPPGARNLIVTSGSQRVIATGALEIVGNATTVSAASFTGPAMAAEAIGAAFGVGLATATETAGSLPLPFSLAGTTVRVRDSANAERLAPLFFVSPGQINYQIPPGTANGTATVTIINGNGAVAAGNIQINTVAPGLFAANANGQGVAAAVVLRIRGSAQTYEPVATFDSATNRFVAVPINFGPSSDVLYLILFGTGIRGRSQLSAVTATIGGTPVTVEYAGPAPGFVGLDQLNLRLERSLAGRGELNIALTVDGISANTVTVRFQ